MEWQRKTKRRKKKRQQQRQKNKKEIACATLRNIRPDIIKQCVDRINAITIHTHAHTLAFGRHWCWSRSVVAGRKCERVHKRFVPFVVTLFLRTPMMASNRKRKLCTSIYYLTSASAKMRIHACTRVYVEMVCYHCSSFYSFHWYSAPELVRDAYVGVVDFHHAHVDVVTTATAAAVDAAAAAAAS